MSSSILPTFEIVPIPMESSFKEVSKVNVGPSMVIPIEQQIGN